MALDAFRCTLTLPSDQAQLLSHCAKRMGVSQSAVVSCLLEGVLPRLALGLGADADPGTPTRRLVESTRSVLREEMREAVSRGSNLLQSDLFASV
jgi:hypothetical protein